MKPAVGLTYAAARDDLDRRIRQLHGRVHEGPTPRLKAIEVEAEKIAERARRWAAAAAKREVEVAAR